MAWAGRAWSCIVLAGVIAAVVYEHHPIFADLSKWGGHDWDVATAFRYFVNKSLLEFHQFPFWNPYSCGGHDAWAYVESDVTLVSPWFPVYLLMDLRRALRVEVLGMAILATWGAWMAAGRVTRSASMRGFIAALFVLNSRWAAQAAHGHSWHLDYACIPWLVYFWHKAATAEPHREGDFLTRAFFRNTLAAACLFAFLIYSGGLYPLPHAILVLGVFALFTAVARRAWQPIVALAASGLVGVALSAPKLLPILALFRRAPRLIDSTEEMSPRVLLEGLLTPNAVAGTAWGPHEYIFYIGAIGVVIIVVGALTARGAMGHAARVLGILMLVLSLGSFHEFAPWPLLHKLPIFSSQHVPSRFLLPAVFCLSLAAASQWESWRRALASRFRPVELLLTVALAATLVDLAHKNAGQYGRSFWMQFTPHQPATEFRQYKKPPPENQFVVNDWGIPTLPSMMHNGGSVECTGVGYVGVFGPSDGKGGIVGRGAKPVDDPDYKGEVFTVQGHGQPRIVRFTPNEVEVDLGGAPAGDTLIMNQNFHEGWRANGRPTFAFTDRVAHTIAPGESHVTFRYRSPYFAAGMLTFSITTLGLIVLARRLRRRSSFSHVS